MRWVEQTQNYIPNYYSKANNMTINKIPRAILSVFTVKNLWVEKEAMTEKVHKSEAPSE